jgi:hypothetical protein
MMTEHDIIVFAVALVALPAILAVAAWWWLK